MMHIAASFGLFLALHQMVGFDDDARIWDCRDDLSLDIVQSSPEGVSISISATGSSRIMIYDDGLPFDEESATDYFFASSDLRTIIPRKQIIVGHKWGAYTLLAPGQTHEYKLKFFNLFHDVSTLPRGTLFWRWRYDKYLNGKYRCDIFGRTEISG